MAVAIGIAVRAGDRPTLVMDELARQDSEKNTAEARVPKAEESREPAATPEASNAHQADAGAEPTETTPAPTPPPWWHGPLQPVRALLETVVPALLIAIGINLFLAQATQVQGQSMEPNLYTAQRLVVEKVTYHFHGPRHGDIVVIDLPEAGPDLLIKRVIGLPGETISSQGGQVFINGEPLEEPYVLNPGGREITEQTIPPLHVFVMGDNRRFSNDSRNFGPVAIDDIIGRAWFSYWPLELLGPIH